METSNLDLQIGFFAFVVESHRSLQNLCQVFLLTGKRVIVQTLEHKSWFADHDPQRVENIHNDIF